MRLLIAGLWTVAAVLWLGWAVLAVRLIVDTAMGVNWNANPLVDIVLVPAWPSSTQHITGPWRLISWWPIGALCAVAMVALGWRLYWLHENGLLYRGPFSIALSIIFPVIAPFMFWADAIRRHKEGAERYGKLPPGYIPPPSSSRL